MLQNLKDWLDKKRLLVAQNPLFVKYAQTTIPVSYLTIATLGVIFVVGFAIIAIVF